MTKFCHPEFGCDCAVTAGAKKVIEVTVRFKVTETENGDAEELRDCIVEYITHPDYHLREDYGPDAWGGFDGAFITDAKIVNSKIEDA